MYMTCIWHVYGIYIYYTRYIYIYNIYIYTRYIYIYTIYIYIHTYRKIDRYIHYITLHYIALHYIALHYIIYIALHCITLHYITVQYITLHYIRIPWFIATFPVNWWCLGWNLLHRPWASSRSVLLACFTMLLRLRLQEAQETIACYSCSCWQPWWTPGEKLWYDRFWSHIEILGLLLGFDSFKILSDLWSRGNCCKSRREAIKWGPLTSYWADMSPKNTVLFFMGGAFVFRSKIRREWWCPKSGYHRSNQLMKNPTDITSIHKPCLTNG